MKGIVLAFLLVLFSTSVAMAACARDEFVTGTWSTGGSWATSALSVGANRILVAVVYHAGTGAAGDLTNGPCGVPLCDDQSNLWEFITTQNNVPGGQRTRLSMYYVRTPVNASTIVTTYAHAFLIDKAFTVVLEYSGADTTSPLNQFTSQQQATPTTSVNATTSGTVTTTTAGQCVVGASMDALFNSPDRKS